MEKEEKGGTYIDIDEGGRQRETEGDRGSTVLINI